MLKQTAKPPHRSFPPGRFGHSPPFVAAERHALSPHPTKQGGSGVPQPRPALPPRRERFPAWLQKKEGKKKCLFLETASQRRTRCFCCAKRRRSMVSTSNPPGKVGGKAPGANPRLSTRAVKLRKGDELPIAQRDEPASKWPDAAGAKGSHPPAPHPSPRSPRGGDENRRPGPGAERGRKKGKGGRGAPIRMTARPPG